MTATTIYQKTIKMDFDTQLRLLNLSAARQRTPHWLLSQALREYLTREEKREAFRQDGIKAWNEYQATGLHVTAAEADAWLAKLEAGQDVEPPECHV